MRNQIHYMILNSGTLALTDRTQVYASMFYQVDFKYTPDSVEFFACVFDECEELPDSALSGLNLIRVKSGGTPTRGQMNTCNHEPLINDDGTSAVCDECDRPICKHCGKCFGGICVQEGATVNAQGVTVTDNCPHRDAPTFEPGISVGWLKLITATILSGLLALTVWSQM